MIKRRHFIIKELSDTEFIVEGIARPKSFSTNEIPMLSLEVEELSELQADLARKDGDKLVGAAMLMGLIKPTGTREWTGAETPWGINAVGAVDSVYTGKGSTVAILDSGIDRNHPAFAHLNADKLIEKDFTGTNNGDEYGHGTHCAATIFGTEVDGQRIGVAPNIKKAYVGKVLDSHGGGTAEMLFDGLLWAVQEGVDVISLSIGFDFPGQVQKAVQQFNYDPAHAASQTLVEFVQNLRAFEAIVQMIEARRPGEEGSLVVAAAGNESTEKYRIAASLPAATRNVISVGAVTPSKQSAREFDIARFSNSQPEVVAPGVDVLSARSGGGLVLMDGTSMACPHVAGVAAQWWEFVRKSPVVTKAEIVRERLLAACKENPFIDEVEYKDRGRGIVSSP